jgi:hypothetical protein
MFKSLILVAVIAFSSHGGVVSEDSSSLPDNATLACKLGPDKAIYLFQQEKMVLLSPEAKQVLPLTLEFFEVYRCPGCFGFVGRVEGRRYEGHTEGVYREETGLWDVFMDLVIDGGEPQRLGCFWRH